MSAYDDAIEKMEHALRVLMLRFRTDSNHIDADLCQDALDEWLRVKVFRTTETPGVWGLLEDGCYLKMLFETEIEALRYLADNHEPRDTVKFVTFGVEL